RRGCACRDRADRAVLRRIAHEVALPGTRADAGRARAAERGELLVDVVVTVVVERVTRFGHGQARGHRALGRGPRRGATGDADALTGADANRAHVGQPGEALVVRPVAIVVEVVTALGRRNRSVARL